MKRFRPRLEALDGRCLPSTLTVTSPKDSGAHTLRAAIAAARPNDVIVISPKLDGQTIALTTGEVRLTKNLTIQGLGAGQLTISAGNRSRVFDVDAGVAVTLTGLAVNNGNGIASNLFPGSSAFDGYGGGILNHGTLTVDNCTLSRDAAAYAGGGIYSDGTLTVRNSTVANNSAEDGGGLYNAGTATVAGSTVSDNVATDPTGFPTTGYVYFGGGIYNAGTLTVTGSALTGNYGDLGGAIFNGGAATVTGSTVTGNSAGLGGGIYTAFAPLTVTGSLFSNNGPDQIDGSYVDGGGNTFN